MNTQDNLKKAFIGESQAKNKYTFFAKVAKNEGYHYIAKVFEEAALNEFQHAKEEFKLLGGISNTANNLKAAAKGEKDEHQSMYPEMEKQAREEGNEKAAELFKTIAEVEQEHEQRFNQLLEMVEKETVYKRNKEINWKCSKCGFIHKGTEPPKECPCCKHAKEYYEPECMCFRDDCDLCNC